MPLIDDEEEAQNELIRQALGPLAAPPRRVTRAGEAHDSSHRHAMPCGCETLVTWNAAMIQRGERDEGPKHCMVHGEIYVYSLSAVPVNFGPGIGEGLTVVGPPSVQGNAWTATMLTWTPMARWIEEQKARFGGGQGDGREATR